MSKINLEVSDEAREALGLLKKDVLDTYKREFDYLSSAFRDLDSKAQGTSAIAGIFLAAVLAFVNRQGMVFTSFLKMTALLGVICLIASLFFSLQAMTVRQIMRPPSGDDVGKLLRDLSSPSALIDIRTRALNFQGDVVTLWMESVRERKLINNRKGLQIQWAQRMLGFSGLLAAIIITVVILKG